MLKKSFPDIVVAVAGSVAEAVLDFDVLCLKAKPRPAKASGSGKKATRG